MHRSNFARTVALTGLVMILVLGMASAAFAGTITQSPNYSGQTWAIGSSHTISWTSSSLVVPGDTLNLVTESADWLGSPNVLMTGLPQNGSVVWTVPATVPTGVPQMVYLTTASGNEYSDAANIPWPVTFSPAVVVSTPASSPWSLALGAVAGLALIAATPAVRRRFAGIKA
jgi:hypothetical protein